MVKYYIEEGENIDFYNELNKSLNEPDIQLDNENYCLITNEKLTENFVELKCGHKFNYLPIYKDLINYKHKFMSMDHKNHLTYNQIRCPYCRNKQEGLLPYIEMAGVTLMHGINFVDEKQKYYYNGNNGYDRVINGIKYSYGECCYIPKTVKNPIENEKYCSNKIVTILNEDSKNYCYKHIEKVKLNYLKLKEKNDKKEAKNKLKVEKEKEKNALKIIKSTNLDENIVISSNNKCQEELKTGKNKGNLCLSKVYLNCLCKRHYNYNVKNNLK